MGVLSQVLNVYHVSGEHLDVRLEFKAIDDIPEKHLLIKLFYSSLNYKDALAVTGRGKILKSFPLIPGIDGAGVVIQTRSSLWKEGDEVVITGQGFGETRDGGYSSYVVVPEHMPIALPPSMTLKESMMFGTAGFTAALCWIRMHQNGQRPDHGPILVSGASGGVGSFSIKLWSQNHYVVEAISSSQHYFSYLKTLGASVIHPLETFLQSPSSSLGSSKWGGGVDQLGGEVLARMISHTSLYGHICSVGLALSPQLHTTVMPFILRGVSLLGISSTNASLFLRREAWNLLNDNHSGLLSHFPVQEITLKEILPTAKTMLDHLNPHRGRFVVKLE
jgi:putative YhdH/YhfP family quinone oxidoreductase